jgi:cytochrome b subunit of formate dehydrogenase
MLIWENRFAFRATVHRIAALVLLASLAYHLIHLLIVRRDRAFWRDMLPSWNDLRDLRDMLSYNLGLNDTRPTFGKFSYVEKIEYFAFLWGTAIMASTGFVLWLNNLAMRHSPKWVSDAATTLHFYEAILATSAIAIWHMYSVLFDPDVYPMECSWITGDTRIEHLQKIRPGYCAEVVKCEQPEPVARNAAKNDSITKDEKRYENG